MNMAHWRCYGVDRGGGGSDGAFPTQTCVFDIRLASLFDLAFGLRHGVQVGGRLACLLAC
jgi:hypothetical protein